MAQTAIQQDKCCEVIVLDAKNEFNTAKGEKIIETLVRPRNTDVEFLLRRRSPTTCGLPQGSVLGLLLSLVTHNEMWTPGLPNSAATIGNNWDHIKIKIIA